MSEPKGEVRQPGDPDVANRALREYSVGGFPAGYGHIFDYVIAKKAGRPPPRAAEKAILVGLDALLRKASTMYAATVGPDSKKISFQQTLVRLVDLKQPSTAAVSAAFAKSLGLHKGGGPKTDSFGNLYLAVLVARRVIRGKTVSSAIERVAMAQARDSEIDNTSTVKRAWQSHKRLATKFAEMEQEHHRGTRPIKEGSSRPRRQRVAYISSSIFAKL